MLWLQACGNSLPVWTILYAMSTTNFLRDMTIPLSTTFVQNYVKELRTVVWPALGRPALAPAG